MRRAQSATFPWDRYRQLADLGLLGIGLPERYVGTGADGPVLLGLAAETLAHGDVNELIDAAAEVRLLLRAGTG